MTSADENPFLCLMEQLKSQSHFAAKASNSINVSHLHKNWLLPEKVWGPTQWPQNLVTGVDVPEAVF